MAASPRPADATATMALVDAYLQWLQKTPVDGDKPQHSPRSQSDHTPLRLLRLWQTIAKFVYRAPAGCTAGTRPETPILKALQRRLRTLKASLSSHQSLNLVAAKRLEWEQFESLVEALRQECQPRQLYATTTVPGLASPGAWRSPATIAFCYQRFLFAALLELLPQQRSVFFRRLVVQLPGSPLAVTVGATHPVGVSGFLTLEAGQWCIDLVQSTTTAQGKIILDNKRYDDGRCFYAYLEVWLVQYTDAKRELPGLRSVFQPQHDYLLTKRNGQPYTRANALKHLLRNPAFRLTGQLPTPETIRLVFED